MVFPVLGVSQLTIEGNGLFTDSQKVEMVKRWNDPESTFPGNQVGYNSDVVYHKESAAEFYSDVITNSGPDRGRYTWMDSEPSGVIIGNGKASPNALRSPCGKCIGNIHSAAIRAYLENDIVLAMAVWSELHALALDDKLDASNGGIEREFGEPKRENPTFGTVRRHNYDADHDTHPYFMWASKLEQYLHSYGIIYDLIKQDSNYKSQEQIVNYWFKDWADFMMSVSDNRAKRYLGEKWRKFSRDYKNSTFYSGAGKNQTHAYFDSNGNNGQLRISTAQSGALSNRSFDRVAFIAAFGTYFNSPIHRDFAFDYFKAGIQIGMFPDGTWNEWYRSHDGKTNLGGDYTFTTLMHFVIMAQNHAVAVNNGFKGVSDPGKYYDYVTSEGSDERMPAYASSSTSGGKKGILLGLMNLSKYYRSKDSDGYINIRYNEAGKSYNLRGLPFHLPTAIANTYYKNQGLYDFYKFIPSAGYGSVKLKPNKSANIRGPHTMGISWGMGQTIGGLFPYGEMESHVFAN